MHLGELFIPCLATSTMRTHSADFEVPSTFSVHSAKFTVRVSVLKEALDTNLLGSIFESWTPNAT